MAEYLYNTFLIFYLPFFIINIVVGVIVLLGKNKEEAWVGFIFLGIAFIPGYNIYWVVVFAIPTLIDKLRRLI